MLASVLLSSLKPSFLTICRAGRLHCVLVTMMTKQFSRLPTSVVPSHYVVRLKPDLAKHTFQGEVTITAKVAEAVTEVMCNAANLEIQKCTVSCGEDGGSVQDRASNEDSRRFPIHGEGFY